MTDLTAFPPLTFENRTTIRARVDADANPGISPSDPAFLDTSEGGVWWDFTEACILALERLWDFASIEVPAACFPAYAWGVYLDEHGATIGLPRKDAVAATGQILLTGPPGTLVPTGIQVGATQTDPDVDPPQFESIESAVLAASPGPTGLGVAMSSSGGSLPLGSAFYYVVTATIPNPLAGQPGQPASVETVVSNEVVGVTTSGVSSAVLTWAAVATATGYTVYRSTQSGFETLLVALGNVLTYTDTGAVTPGAVLPPTNLISVQAVTAGIDGNVAAGAITRLLSPTAGVSAVTNPAAISGGAEVETDELYRGRIVLEYSAAAGAGNASDYQRWALAFPPIGFASVQPLWAGAGTVRVIVTDQQNNPVSSVVTVGLQSVLDPVPGLGAGLAPIGAIVTVITPTLLPVNVAATLTLASGYSLDGLSGTIPLRADIESALDDYVGSLAPAQNVILEHVKSRFFQVNGVLDVSGTTLNGAATNLAVGATEVASLGSVTLA